MSSLIAVDLLFNFRGLGWAWSSEPFYEDPNPATIDPSPIFQALDQDRVARRSALRRAAYPSPPHTAPRATPSTTTLSTHSRTSSSISHLRLRHDPHLLLRRHHVPDLRAGRPDRVSPVPWAVAPHREPPLAGHVRDEFWGKRWHQFFRHFFVVYGSRPGKKIAGWYGSIMGAYLVSAHMHVVMVWGLGRARN
jgi:hypothetical protein